MISQFYFGTTTDGPSFGGRKKIFFEFETFFPILGSLGGKNFKIEVFPSSISLLLQIVFGHRSDSVGLAEKRIRSGLSRDERRSVVQGFAIRSVYFDSSCRMAYQVFSYFEKKRWGI